jgi:hypothetical protein
MSDLLFEGWTRPCCGLPLVEDELDISEARLLEKARDVDEEISLVLVFDACFIP